MCEQCSGTMKRTHSADILTDLTNTNRLQLVMVPEGAGAQFCCDLCQFSCEKKRRLSNHINEVHSDVRPYSCSECQHSAKTKGNLANHVKQVHCEERPYSCPLCHFSCKTNSSLIQHINRVHPLCY